MSHRRAAAARLVLADAMDAQPQGAVPCLVRPQAFDIPDKDRVRGASSKLTSQERAMLRVAAISCMSCPVREPCDTWRQASPDPFGVVAGVIYPEPGKTEEAGRTMPIGQPTNRSNQTA